MNRAPNVTRTHRVGLLVYLANDYATWGALDFNLINYDVTVQHVGHNSTRTLVQRHVICKLLIYGKWLAYFYFLDTEWESVA